MQRDYKEITWNYQGLSKFSYVQQQLIQLLKQVL